MMAAVIGLIGYLGGVRELQEAAELKQDSIHVRGVLSYIEPGDHLNNPIAHYYFSTGGPSQWGSNFIPRAKEATLAPGMALDVSYSKKIGESSLDPEGLVESGRRGILIALFLELVFAAIFLPLVLFAYPNTKKPDWNKDERISGTIVISILVAVGLGALFLSAIPAFLNASKLLHNGQVVTGSLDYVKPRGVSPRAYYTYKVGSRYFHDLEPYEGRLKEGSPVQIRYLADSPSVSAIDPEVRITNSKGAAIFLALWTLLVGAIGLAIRYWSKRFGGPITFSTREDY